MKDDTVFLRHIQENVTRIWDIVERDLPDLKAKTTALLASLPSGNEAPPLPHRTVV